MPIDDFIEVLNDEINGKIRSATLGFSSGGRLILGGGAGISGGVGAPAGGFVGKLAQRYIAYDTSEAATPYTAPSASLVDNLNHIRHDITTLSGMIITISGGGGTASDFLDLTDTPASYDSQAGKVVAVKDDESGLEFITVSGGAGGGSFLDLSDTPSAYTPKAVLGVNATADEITMSGIEADLLYDSLQLNSPSMEDFVLAKRITQSGTAPDIIIEAPKTTSSRGRTIFKFPETAVIPAKAVTFDASDSTSFSGSGTLSFTVGNNSDRILVVATATRGDRSITALTYGGVSLTKAVAYSAGSDRHVEIWYLSDPDVGTADISVTHSGTADTSIVGAISLYNVSGIDSFSGETGGAVTSIDVTLTTETSQLIVDAIALQSNNGTLDSSGNAEQTEREVLAAGSVTLGMSTITGGSSNSYWTFGSDYYAFAYLVLEGIPENSNTEKNVLIVTDSGVGVNSEDPDNQLDVVDSGKNVNILVKESAGTHTAGLNLKSGSADWRLVADPNNALLIKSGETEHARFSSLGYLGLGKTPADILDVAGRGIFEGVLIAETYELHLGSEDEYPTKSWISFGDGAYTSIYEKHDDCIAFTAGGYPDWTNPVGSGNGDVLIAGYDSNYTNLIFLLGDIDGNDHGYKLEINVDGMHVPDPTYYKNSFHERILDRSGESITSTTTVSNTTTETTLFTEAISANELIIGNILKGFACGVFSTANATDTVTLRIKLGTATLATLVSNAASVSGVSWKLNTINTIRSVGASGTVSVFADMLLNTKQEYTTTQTVSINTTSAINLTITAQWSAANASNSLSIYQGYVEFKN